MQPYAEPHAVPSRGGSASDTDISWHSANTAKAHQALSLFANLEASLRTAPAAGHLTRRGSAPAAHAHTPPATSRSADRSLPLSSSPPQKQRHGVGSGTGAPTSPHHGASASTTVTAQLAYTEAEISAMSPAQLRRQLRVASTVTQRLYRRAQQLQKQVEEWEGKCSAPPPQQQTTKSGVNNGGAMKVSGAHSETAAQTVRDAEQRAERLQREVTQLTLEKEALTQQLHEKRRPSQNTGHDGGTASPVHPISSPAAATVRDDNSEVTLLRDTVRQLQRRLALAEEHAQRATQIQLDAVLQHRQAGAAQGPPTVAVVNAEVQKLLELLQGQLLSNAAQQQAERARMNELFYQLERRRGLM
ncbi:hypothetical protein ABB37_08541 [Leptomonas pyrrhocoris]|uniref:Uncharacterized protein n=1 Tax=Leptomonas pyrrhocoris TaxID=157538 RepID=A0A0N1J4C4_LEPPY|nr:hypothetical protein ABB37_08541 [Leptomonas pyrrhocoris]XP_015653668.1 hypothetical protein ABB37_08541 [Leptomonas pyrrhocoris]KPA75228.1 hypothetical protein ABB37_08541 [Leptomonas pyrrhocoris]KPA75229.1 hypothetical protein ABB37_08541 [Leptomonas pyrrhocoris]|eukprot:XP_015653667.1 hypothetical protein ABB37_08541 [Leptomonas pyrrhocoris]